ncbi:MAG: 50S ribosomal protein L29 [Candidatus Neomarinimicrobiota bacterium]|nr:50S ribosomal protein L29 [Candidatus Neomarinimicrobiota bacterium]
MKTFNLNELNYSELVEKLSDNLEAVQNLRFQQALQQLEDSTQIRKIKREVARIKTILREYHLDIRQIENNN